MAAALQCEPRDGVAWCTLARPPLNLIEPGLIGAIRETFQALSADRTIRAAVVTGSGRAFTAGMDVHVLAGLDVAGARALTTPLHAALGGVHYPPLPLRPAVNRPRLGPRLPL